MTSDGLSVIIVGGGFGGLTAAIECRTRGMNATIIETYPTSAAFGDIIDFFPNGGRIIEKWDNGSVGRELMKQCINQGDKFKYYKSDGTLIWQEDWILEPHHFWRQYAGHRGQMHEVVVDYAQSIGVEFKFGDKVVQYVDGDRPSVITASGKTYTGDVVLAADGPRSIAREQVLGLPDNKVNSGYAIFRAYYTLTEEHQRNPLLKEFCDPTVDDTKLWVAKDLHMIVYTWNKGKDLGWVLTHKDDADIGESWSFKGNIQDVLQCLKEGNFEPKLHEIVRNTPPENLVDYKLVWREPIDTWLSKSARIAVIGDAAHCHLPTSAQGGSQAMEDGVAVAVALHRSKGDVPLALRVFERIRFNRSHVTHMASISTRDGYHNVDWDGDDILKNPHILNLPRPAWVLEHDEAENAEQHFDHLAQDVKSGRQGTIQELALPAGGDYGLDSRNVTKRHPVAVR
ncbi:Salicylate hydroxylase [Pleurostoma richardsiae]|uniref:Salicylate hydroxylase n=1 Tax=Pleurostoma richardsiae TaxID=41990 RepID=A0AA38VVW6_9PEZI|nr:Salicylate hydroxylase [Pleurostoma richardsiae]